MNNKPIDLLGLCQDVARHLGDWPVWVRFRDPSTKGAGAEFFVAEGGYGVIDIAPGNDILLQYRNLLHETAHLKLHKETIGESEDYPSGTFIKTSQYWQVEHGQDPRESEADKLRDKWMNWAGQKAGPLYGMADRPRERVIARLKALKNYKE